MREPIWREEPGGNFVAEISRFCLKVYWTADRRQARFDVLKLHVAASPVLLASGTAHDVGEAMRAARDEADRLEPIDKRKMPWVVVVADDETHSDAIADTLRDEGYDVAQAGNAACALQCIERLGRPVVLVTDFYLGHDTTGLQLATQARQFSSNVGVVFMSDVHPSGVNLWENGYLRKPFLAEELVTAVGTVAALCGSRTTLPAAAITSRHLAARIEPATFESVLNASGWCHQAKSLEACARAFPV